MKQTTIKKNTAAVLEAKTYDDRSWVLYCKKQTIQFDLLDGDAADNSGGACVRIGRSYGSFVKQSIRPSSALNIVPLSKVQYYELKADGSIHIVLSVCDPAERKDWSWYHFHGKAQPTTTTTPPCVWGKLSASASLSSS